MQIRRLRIKWTTVKTISRMTSHFTRLNKLHRPTWTLHPLCCCVSSHVLWTLVRVSVRCYICPAIYLSFISWRKKKRAALAADKIKLITSFTAGRGHQSVRGANGKDVWIGWIAVGSVCSCENITIKSSFWTCTLRAYWELEFSGTSNRFLKICLRLKSFMCCWEKKERKKKEKS